jgi:hypothetical protein
MKEPQIAARVADLTHTNDNQRQGELDELLAGLKRLMIDTMARRNDFAALRAIDMIACLRGLIPTTAKRSDSITAALEEMRQWQAEDESEEAEIPAAPEVTFDPPMPPETQPPDEPAPEIPEPPPSPAQKRAAVEATRAAVRRRIFCYEHLMTHHPELSSKIHELSDAEAYFDDSDTLLPPELWPQAGAGAGSNPES